MNILIAISQRQAAKDAFHSHLASVLFTRRGLKSTAHSPSPLKWTVEQIPVHFSGLSLLACELIRRRGEWQVQDLISGT